jgi:hypothetical protein
MAVSVMCLTPMAFRSTGPMFPVLMQRMLGFDPLLVAWTQVHLHRHEFEHRVMDLMNAWPHSRRISYAPQHESDRKPNSV